MLPEQDGGKDGGVEDGDDSQRDDDPEEYEDHDQISCLSHLMVIVDLM